MPILKSISGIRGTIGGRAGDNLTPKEITEFTAAYGYRLLQNGLPAKVVIGRDGRISGSLVNSLVVNTLMALGINVIDLGLSTTPTVEIAVTEENASGGIIITASHNPKEWNALKFLNEKGEFISAEGGKEILEIAEKGDIVFATINHLGSYKRTKGYINIHINKILKLPLVDAELVATKNYKIVVDAINSTGAISIKPLLEALGCEVIVINEEINGKFAHNPEPLPENLRQLSREVKSSNADLGIAVDPDVDRLAFVSPNGEMFGEEYTLVAIADYILKNTPGNTVSNLSSTRALSDVTLGHKGEYFASAVGEVNVVNKMKEVNAVIGGEGNGGIIYPELHYGRDALVGVALFLTFMAKENKDAMAIRYTYPKYQIVKDRIELTPEINVDFLLKKLTEKYKDEKINTIDGLKIDLKEGWIHLRKSNTEPIIRIYTESHSEVIARNMAQKIKSDIGDIIS